MVGDEYKIISVNRRHYPAQASVIGHLPFMAGVDQSDNPPPTLTVLVEGEIGDYAAYTGHGDPQWVARHGDKISFAEACIHFRGIEKEKYRE